MTAFNVLIDATLRMATGLAFPALGELLIERSGLFNIGLEACVLWGALGGLVGSLWLGDPYAGIAVGAMFGLLNGLLFGLLVVPGRMNAVLVGTALNLIALGGTGFVYRAMFGHTGTGAAVPLLSPMLQTDLPAAGPLLSQSLMLPVAVALTASLGWFFFRTRAGVQWRACGEDAEAAAMQGVQVSRVRLAACALGCMLAGVGGAFLVVGAAGVFVERMSAGRGFMALAIVVLGRWRPGGVLAGALLFGVAGALQFFFQALGTGVAYQWLLMLPYVLTLAVLALGRRSNAAPALLK
jgi:simple sugar transport system permease protein